MDRTDLTETQWRKLEPHLPSNPHHGHVYVDHRHVINGILWRLRTGAPWRDILSRYGPWQRLLKVMQAAADEAGLVDRDGAALDATHVNESSKCACMRSPQES